MSNFVPQQEHMREALLLCFDLKKSSAECLWRPIALSETTCRDWFRRFKDGHFNLSDEKREYRPRKAEDHELQALLDKDDTQTQKMPAEKSGATQPPISMRLSAMDKVQKSE